MTSTRRLLRAPIVYAIAVAVLVSSVTWLLAMQRPTEYQARVDLLAVPRQGADPSSSYFPAVASQMLPAIIAAAHSPEVLATASGAAEGAPSAAELGELVVVDVIPNSLLTRLSVRAPSAAMARELILTITTEVVADDLLAPIGDLRPIGDEPSAVKVAPDRLLATGLAISAGAAAAVAVLVLIALIHPAERQRVTRALAIAGVSRPVSIIDLPQKNALAELEILSTASARPVRVVALTPSAASSVATLSAALASAGVPMADDRSEDAVSVIGLTSDADVDTLPGAISALPGQARVIAVVLTHATPPATPSRPDPNV